MSGALLASVLGGLALLALFRRISTSRPQSPPKSVAIVVLGDIGRSPRMLYHAESFARHGYTTWIVAHRGSPPSRALSENPHVKFVYLDSPLAWTSNLPRPVFLLVAPLKILLGAWGLAFALMSRIEIAPGYLFVQNPPAIPTLPIVKLVSLVRGCRVVIDWHNTGYSMLSLRLGETHPAVKVAKRVELYFGRAAYAHLTVTNAMKRLLIREAQIEGRAETFYDRPPKHFRRLEPQESHELFQRMPSLRTLSFDSSSLPTASTAKLSSTLFTHSDGSLATDRPALLVTSTSHTPDEDLSILVDALSRYDASARRVNAALCEGDPRSDRPRSTADEQRFKDERLPKVVVIVTGRGQGKAEFERRVERRFDVERWEYVRIVTEWLALEDYPKLLGSADLGISLHSSTSGVDLPMKVVDMYGCDLPALALDFECIGELVQDGKNGRTFRTVEQLHDQIIDVLQGFPFSDPSQFPSKLDVLRAGIRDARYGTARDLKSEIHVRGARGTGAEDEDEEEEEEEDNAEEEETVGEIIDRTVVGEEEADARKTRTVERRRREGGDEGRWTDWESNWDRVVLDLL
ncbi:hypothetical protein JCM10212_001074 [Sporobolomyces blumeae]